MQTSDMPYVKTLRPKKALSEMAEEVKLEPSSEFEEEIGDLIKSSISEPKNAVRPQKEKVAQMLAKITPNDKIELLEELKRQLKDTYFSQMAIDKEMEAVSFKLFFYPSKLLAKTIELYAGVDESSIIHNCVAFRHGDLLLLKERLNEYVKSDSREAMEKEIEAIMKDLIAWGSYLLDIRKLEAMSTVKRGNSENRKYTINELDMEITIDDNVTVVYKNSEITPTTMKNKVLKEMAVDRLKKKATEVMFQVLKAQEYGGI